jgi:long-chain acyl-CoA synthetase
VASKQAAQETLEGLPGRIHEVMDRHVVATPDRPALVDDGTTLTYRALDRSVRLVAETLRALGIRAGDRMMIVSENSIPLACLLLAASRLDAWAIVVNPRLSPREVDQIRDHSAHSSRRMYRRRQPPTPRDLARPRRMSARSMASASLR